VEKSATRKKSDNLDYPLPAPEDRGNSIIEKTRANADIKAEEPRETYNLLL
jgi:hypothetical protein